MTMTPPTSYMSMSMALSHLGLWFAIDVVGFRRTTFEKLEVKLAFGFCETWNCEWVTGSIAIVGLS